MRDNRDHKTTNMDALKAVEPFKLNRKLYGRTCQLTFAVSRPLSLMSTPNKYVLHCMKF